MPTRDQCETSFMLQCEIYNAVQLNSNGYQHVDHTIAETNVGATSNQCNANFNVGGGIATEHNASQRESNVSANSTQTRSEQCERKCNAMQT
jgi:hypothetical protein